MQKAEQEYTVICLRGISAAILIVLSLLSMALMSPYIYAEALGNWTSTTNYPLSTYNSDCIVYAGYVYCVGGTVDSPYGFTDAVYYAQLSSSGVGSWTSTASYLGGPIYDHDCVEYAGYIYCVGGIYVNGPYGTPTNAVYYAQLSSSGVGTWTSTTNYPTTVFNTSCVVDSGYIYCVGGYSSGYSSAVYYAQLSPTGGLASAWTSTTSYPLHGQNYACVAYSAHVYCFPGYTDSGLTNAVYYAQLSSSGVGSWTSTTTYPFSAMGQSCVEYAGYVYCICGDTRTNPQPLVYYAQLSSSGVGSWTSATDYPIDISRGSCVASGGYVYCVGGSGANVYYAQIGAQAGRVYSVVRGTDNHIYYGSDVAGSWSGWTALPGSTSGSPAAVVCGASLHVAVRGSDNGVYYGYVTLSTGGFSGWTRISGSTLSAPGLAADSSCNLYLVVRGSNNGIYLNVLPSGGVWSSWSTLPGSTIDSPAVAVAGSTLHIAVRGSDGSSIYDGRKDLAGGVWLGWTRVSGSSPSRPALAAVSASEVYLAVRGSDSRVYLNRWSGTAWTGWSMLPTGSTSNGPSVVAANSQLYVAVQGGGNGIYWCDQALPSGSWSSWSKLPGATPSSPTLA